MTQTADPRVIALLRDIANTTRRTADAVERLVAAHNRPAPPVPRCSYVLQPLSFAEGDATRCSLSAGHDGPHTP